MSFLLCAQTSCHVSDWGLTGMAFVGIVAGILPCMDVLINGYCG